MGRERIYGVFPDEDKTLFIEILDEEGTYGRKFRIAGTHDKTLGVSAQYYTLFYDNARCGTSEQLAELELIE